MSQRTKIFSNNLKNPLGDVDITIASGVNVLSEGSGVSNLGSSDYPFDTIYADNFYGIPTYTGTTPIEVSENVISILSGSSTVDGYISSGDWNTFNNKQDLLGYTPVNVSGDTMTGTLNAPVLSGTVISGDNFYRQGVELTNYTLPSTISVSVLSGTTISGDSIYKDGTEISDLYVNVSGDTMTGTLNFVSGASILPVVSGVNNIGTESFNFLDLFTHQINGGLVINNRMNECPDPIPDGIVDTFTFTNTIFEKNIALYVSGIYQVPSGIGTPTFDYEISGNSVVFTSAPTSGVNIIGNYNYA